MNGKQKKREKRKKIYVWGTDRIKLKFGQGEIREEKRNAHLAGSCVKGICLTREKRVGEKSKRPLSFFFGYFSHSTVCSFLSVLFVVVITYYILT